jgi:hypothetical protein
MSQVAISGNASGTGTLTIASPNTNSNYTLTLPENTGTLISTKSAGTVLQVVNAVKTDKQSTTSTTYVDITSLTVTITPTSTSSKILVMARINNIGNASGEVTGINLLRGSTTITSSTAGGFAQTKSAWATGGGGGMTNDNRKVNSVAIDYLDSPATTSATIYKMQMLTSNAASAGTVNAWQLNNDLASVSSITVMEIAG